MNPTLLTTLSFLLFILTTCFPLVFTKYVYDIHGKLLVPGDKYYISQTTTSGQEGGALILGETETGGGGVEACALTVLQEFCEDNDGLPVIFSVPDDGFVISENLTNVEIEFVNNKPNCAQSSKWVVVENPVIFDRKWISIGSSEDLGDVTQIVDGVFRIKKQGKGYKLVFYSRWSRSFYDIKRYNDVDGRRLVAIDFESKKYHPFEIEFVNAKIYGRSVV